MAGIRPGEKPVGGTPTGSDRDGRGPRKRGWSNSIAEPHVPAESAALDENAEGAAKMFRVGEGLKLAGAGGNPWFERRVADTHPLHDAGQEPSLRHKFFCPQSFCLADIANGAEVDMGS